MSVGLGVFGTYHHRDRAVAGLGEPDVRRVRAATLGKADPAKVLGAPRCAPIAYWSLCK